MKKAELTREIALQSKLSRADAADQLDRVVHEILQRVRKGQPATLPGLGTFAAGQDGTMPSRPPRRAAKRGQP
jgi:nucleoid DNA-binding protein